MSIAPAPKRRWQRFSLRTLFVVVTVIGGWLAYEANRIHEQARAVAIIESLGGYVDYDFRRRLGYDAEPPGPRWLRSVLGEYYAAKVIEAQLSRDAPTLRGGGRPELFTDEHARQIAVLVDLDWLVLDDTKMTDEGLQCLKSLKKLGRLDLEGTPVTEQGVMELRRALPQARISHDGGSVGTYARPWYDQPD
jgi:hypothetical protein